tara:strand:- start:6761 stop:7735 length:975 start_codon:yes stop_codon:yes gene_type:complete
MDVVKQWGIDDKFTFNISTLTITCINGSQFILTGLDDPEKIKSIQGITRIWIEEATELTEPDFNQLDLRLRGVPEPQITLTYNPVDRDHWINKRFHECDHPNSSITKSTFEDNDFIDDQYKSVLMELANQDLNYYRIYALGEWGHKTEGLIYTKFNIVDSVPDPDELVFGLDFGFNNPTSLIKISMKDQQPYIEELIYESKLTNSDLIGLMKSLTIGKSVIYADAAEPQRIEEIYRAGFNVKPAHKVVRDGIDFCKRYDLNIVKGSINLIKELRGYKWKEDRTGKVLDEPVKFNDHACDAFRYALFTHYGKKKRAKLLISTNIN